ncbi:translation elongation factor Ts [Buchnera aphidicola]|uniref:translation elongation factor Ts n=1 Tax=Buchnera aphidicola TaxID=9 RepID=UPI0031B857D1
MCINTKVVKELRLRSGIGIMECKKALVAANGDLEKAIIILKKNGYIKAENKFKNLATKGIIALCVKKNISYILELNCETDFVEKNLDFLQLGKEILFIAHTNQINNLSDLQTISQEKIVSCIARFNENIFIRRFGILHDVNITSYLHRNKIGVLLQAYSKNKMILKNIAMHIASQNPDYLERHAIPSEILEKEKQIQLEIILNSGKPKNILNKIVEGKIEKFVNSICLLEQSFIFDATKKVKDIIHENNVKVLKFIRFAVGQ